MTGQPRNHYILPVPRTREQARRYYDRLSGIYDIMAGSFERRYAMDTLARLSVQAGETVMEIGFGTGHCLERLAELVGDSGKARGADISPGMLNKTRRRLVKAGLSRRVELSCADALELPWGDRTFDAVFMSFTLELFDTPEIPAVLDEVKRVLKPGGRFGAVSMSKEGKRSLMLRLYEWAHEKWPAYADCRPIYLADTMRDAGFTILTKETADLFGLPVEMVTARIVD